MGCALNSLVSVRRLFQNPNAFAVILLGVHDGQTDFRHRRVSGAALWLPALRAGGGGKAQRIVHLTGARKPPRRACSSLANH